LAPGPHGIAGAADGYSYATVLRQSYDYLTLHGRLIHYQTSYEERKAFLG